MEIRINCIDEILKGENEKLAKEASKNNEGYIDSGKMLNNYAIAVSLYTFNYVKENNNDYDSEIIKLLTDKLFESNSFDVSYNWHPSQMPWITARILISLSNNYYIKIKKEYELLVVSEKLTPLMICEKKKFKNYLDHIDDAISFLIRSLKYDDSGKVLGWDNALKDWVTKVENDALCMEALLNFYDDFKAVETPIENMLNYYLEYKRLSNLLKIIREFDEEENESSKILPWIILSSEIIRIIKKLNNGMVRYSKELFLLLNSLNGFTKKFVTRLSKSPLQEKENGAQSATSQILYYLCRVHDK